MADFTYRLLYGDGETSGDIVLLTPISERAKQRLRDGLGVEVRRLWQTAAILNPQDALCERAWLRGRGYSVEVLHA